MPRYNNFDFLRLIAATFVIWSHVAPLSGQAPIHANFGAAGVFMFFSISGFLVTQSWDRDPSTARFLGRRILRILPGLAVVVALSACVLGPLVTDLPLGEYFREPRFAAYWRNILLFPLSLSLPGVFDNNPLRWVVNGSLWTLPIEALMYASLAALGSVRAWTATTITFCLGALSVLVVYAANYWWPLPGQLHPVLLTVDVAETVDCAFCFFFGAFVAKHQSRIPMFSWSWVVVLAAVYLLYPDPRGTYVLIFALPYAALAFALRPLPVIRSVGRFGDFSYGVYIYAFPIMQILIGMFPGMSDGGFFIVSFVCSLAAGALSWHLVESRALRLKRYIGRRTLPSVRAPDLALANEFHARGLRAGDVGAHSASGD